MDLDLTSEIWAHLQMAAALIEKGEKEDRKYFSKADWVNPLISASSYFIKLMVDSDKSLYSKFTLIDDFLWILQNFLETHYKANGIRKENATIDGKYDTSKINEVEKNLISALDKTFENSLEDKLQYIEIICGRLIGNCLYEFKDKDDEDELRVVKKSLRRIEFASLTWLDIITGGDGSEMDKAC